MFAPVIVALDFPSQEEAMALVEKLGHACSSYKVGLQLLTEEGPEVVRELTGRGKHVFLDLKLHEIPNSIVGAVRAAGKIGVGMVTVHASAGSAALRAAVTAASEYPNLKVLALTVITSLTDKELPEIGLVPSVRQQVERLATLAARDGCHGIVASAHEAAYLTSLLPSGTLIVTPDRESVLIDSGWPGSDDRDPKRIERVIRDEAKLDHLDHLVTTHWHVDHFGGVEGLARRLRIDHYWDRLGEEGRYRECGWLDDRFGVSWQVVPKVLGQLMSDPERAPRVVQAFMKMKKFDIETLMNA